MKAELIKYCKSDVDVLMKSCLKFRDIFMEETTVDPFEKSLTIASACNIVFRKLFLKRDTIGIIPANGYHPSENQSVIALKWLKWLAKTEKIEIRHKLNGGEVKVCKFKVDGLCGKTIYEFYGCLWHGCPTCMKNRTHPTADRMLNATEAYEKTIEKRTILESNGYTVVEMWECKFKDMIKNDPDLKKFVQSTDIAAPLNPRDGDKF